MGIKEDTGSVEKMRKKIRQKLADKGISVSRIKPDEKVEIGSKQQPYKVRNLKIC